MQSIGASMTYARRYLWVSLLGLVEYDPKNGGDVDLDQLDQNESAVEDKANAPENIADKLKRIQKENLAKRESSNDS